MNIEVLVTSVNEPQLEACFESLRNQTYPFTNIIHINNVVPMNEAYNQGIKRATGDLLFLINGDMSLYNYAVEKSVSIVHKTNNPKMCCYLFGIYDVFLCQNMGQIPVVSTQIYRNFSYRNRLMCDRDIGSNIRKSGYLIGHFNKITLGNHFNNPDEFQVFKRFYVSGNKYLSNFQTSLKIILLELFEKTNNPLYMVGIKAIEFSVNHREYPGSNNLDFDRKMYLEFKKTYGDTYV